MGTERLLAEKDVNPAPLHSPVERVEARGQAAILVAPVWAMIAMAISVSVVLSNSFAGRLLPGETRVR